MRGGNTQEKIIYWLFADKIPVTKILIVANILTAVLVGLFRLDILAYFMVFRTDSLIAMPWTAITYPLIWVGDAIGLLFSVIWLWFVGGSLERSWGSRVFGLFFFGVSAITAFSLYLGASIIPGINPVALHLAGLWMPLAAVTVAFAMLNPEQQIMFWYVIPLKLKYLAIIDVAIVFYNYGRMNLVLGVFALAGCAFSYWYVRHGRDSYRQPQRAADSAKDIRLYQRKGIFSRLNPVRWYKDYRERKKLKDFLDRSGFDR